MHFDDAPKHAAFRARVREFISENAPFDLYEELRHSSHGHLDLLRTDGVTASKRWRRKRYDNGWACLQWPTAYGGMGLTPIEALIWEQEEGPFRHLDTLFLIGVSICAPTIMAWGTDEQKERLLPPIASGEDIWCQLFSEPSAGSDLAGIRTRAKPDNSDWVVDGQKIWTSGGADSDWGMLLARTDPQQPKHRGLTMFYVDMRTEGLNVVPIKQMNGQSHFNEVFFENVRLPDSQRIGDVGCGWKVALSLLNSERLGVGQHIMTGFDELLAYCNTLDFNGAPLIHNPGIRGRLADLAVRDYAIRFTQYRIMTALARCEPPGPEVSILKLAVASTFQAIATLGMEIQGPAGGYGLDQSAEKRGHFERALLRSPGARLEGGTDEILRNIIAERILNLPPDIRIDKNIPFADISRS